MTHATASAAPGARRRTVRAIDIPSTTTISQPVLAPPPHTPPPNMTRLHSTKKSAPTTMSTASCGAVSVRHMPLTVRGAGRGAGTGVRKSSGRCIRRPPSEAEARQVLGVALPVGRHLDAQREEHLRADERLDACPGARADLLQAGTALADDDALLAVALDPEVGIDLDELLVVALHDVVDRHRERVRQLV